ncbi:MAG: glutamate--tRNA ligase family protein [Gemmatimonadota bacterium]|nr:glutamate--tRNA ligase family protein [Gemmatimonadota bacterium]
MPLTRYAPAPTGYLHLGHVANALYVWSAAAARNARVLLRVEDHDRQRCRAIYETALLDDLDWLGLVPDVAPTTSYRGGPNPWRQSDNGQAYRAAVAQLRAAGYHVYACDCSRATDAASAPATGANQERPYSGHCRTRGLPEARGSGLRVELAGGDESFVDLRLGPQSQSPAEQCGDLLLRDRLGNWTYQFGVVVDDLRQGIDLIVRGADLLDSTGRQLRLARMLGRETLPTFLHHPLILKPNGDKLSKSARDSGVPDLRAAGWTQEAVFGLVLQQIGLSGEAGAVSLEEALAVVGRSPGLRE